MRILDLLARIDDDNDVKVVFGELLIEQGTCGYVWNKLNYFDMCNYHVSKISINHECIVIEVI